MNKFMDFAKRYNLFELSLIILFILILYPIFYAKQSTYLVDYGREAYIPWQMLNGEVLYKDIFNVYGPLGYQINALAYKFIGINLNTLYLLGVLNSILISCFVYLISRIFLERKIALCISGVVITFCIFSEGVHNLVMPYSFNAVYAVSAVLISIYTMLLYIKEKKVQNLVLSFLFAGFAFANKIEYVPYFCFLFFVLPFVLKDKKDWKCYLLSLISFFVFPAISFGVLLLQGAKLSDFLNAFVLMKKLLEAPATQYFYKFFGLYFNPQCCVLSLKLLGNFLKQVIPLSVLFYVLNFINSKFVGQKALKILLNVFIFVLSMSLLKFYIPDYKVMNAAFSWIGMFLLAIFIGCILFEVWQYFKRHKIEVSEFGKMFLFLCTASILLSIKGLFHVVSQSYGTLTIPFLIIPVFVVFSHYLPHYVRKLNREIWLKTVVTLSLMGMAIFLYSNIDRIFNYPRSVVAVQRGVIYAPGLTGQDILVNYIKYNTPKNASLVVMPEGTIINFLSERKSHNYYYYLMPVNIQVFGQEKVLEDFNKNPPDYFLVYNIPYMPYNEGTFGQYASKITNFVLENYVVELSLNDMITFVLYRRK